MCEVKLAEQYNPGYNFNYGQYYVTAVNLWGADGLAGRAVKISEGTVNTEDLVAVNPNTNIANYATTWYACDYQGNAVKQYTADGTLTASYAFDAFGNFIKQYTEETVDGVTTYTLAVDTPSVPYAYNAKSGYYYDSEIGMYYCWHRYYDPANGRWLTEDPIGYEGGLNLYGYCGNMPVGSVDWSGTHNAYGAPNDSYDYMMNGPVDGVIKPHTHQIEDKLSLVREDLKTIKNELINYMNDPIRNTYNGCVSVDNKNGFIYIISPMLVRVNKNSAREYKYVGKFNVVMTLNVNDLDRKIEELYTTFAYGNNNSCTQPWLIGQTIYLGKDDYWSHKAIGTEDERYFTLLHEILHYDTSYIQEAINEKNVGGEHYDTKAGPKNSYGDVEHCSRLMIWLLGLTKEKPTGVCF